MLKNVTFLFRTIKSNYWLISKRWDPNRETSSHATRQEHIYDSHYQYPHGSRDSLLVRAPDSWSKGCEFESRRQRRENFLLQSQLCVLTLIRCPYHPRVTAVARKRSRWFCQKYRWQDTHKHAYTLDPSKKVGVGWLHRCPGRVWESIRKRSLTQLVREHSVTVVSAR